MIAEREKQRDIVVSVRDETERHRLEVNRYLRGIKALAALAKKSKTPSAESESQPEASDGGISSQEEPITPLGHITRGPLD